MERKISVPLYAGALIISLVIFIIGIFVGQIIDASNLQTISEDLSHVSQKVASINLLLLMEDNSSSFCPVYMEQLQSIDQEIEIVGHKLTYLEEEKNIYDSELKKDYFVQEAESYLLSKKAKQLCNDSSILLVYFYSNVDCASCQDQGIEILKARDELLGKGITVKIYSFDGDMGSSVAESLMTQYNIVSYPSIVVNGAVYSGYKDSNAVSSIIQSMVSE
ncbi:hypothetical protein KKF81_03470 [Candidatus Micrarchaeota archaeon]|nr:hypothetical protein [Candidatus Micrarchaeota archaeon]MBU1165983.1 hypothetical protein [Candidatus Micrarchaeota archaeon]MBU1886440.1 hypothetical protein [Candidatus Micrarchaeota archaeon]